MLPDRLAGLASVALALGIAILAYQFYVPYQYEPLGPALFPYLVASSLCVAGGLLVVRPRAVSMRIGARHVAVLLIMIGYGYVFESLGYLASTAIVALFLGLLVGQPVARAAGTAVALALSTYAVLVGVLELNLPFGWVWASLAGIG